MYGGPGGHAMRRYLSADGDVTVDDGDVMVDDDDVTVDDDDVMVNVGCDVTVVYKTCTRAPLVTAPINLFLYLATCKLLLTREGSFWRAWLQIDFQRADLTEAW